MGLASAEGLIGGVDTVSDVVLTGNTSTNATWANDEYCAQAVKITSYSIKNTSGISSAGNYNITLKDGSLTVNPRPINFDVVGDNVTMYYNTKTQYGYGATITCSEEIDFDLFAPDYAISNKTSTSAHADNVLVGRCSTGTNSYDLTNALRYDYASSKGFSNYSASFSYTAGSLTIVDQPINTTTDSGYVEAQAQNLTYNGSTQTQNSTTTKLVFHAKGKSLSDDGTQLVD